MTIHIVYITAANKSEALSLARMLVQEKHLACANIIGGATSVYWWEGALQEAEEAVIIAKTTAAKVEEMIARAKELHSYECPCVVTLPVEKGNEMFLKWVGETIG